MARIGGVDIGGTKIACGSGTDIYKFRTGNYAESVDGIARWARSEGLEALGVGCPGPLDLRTGCIGNPDTLPDWNGKPLVADLSKATGLRVFMLNDADAALLGELGPNEPEPVAMLTFGTGVGGAIWTGFGVYLGANMEHPEIGHIPVFPDGPACACGQSGCLESVASGSALQRFAQEGGFDSLEQAINQNGGFVERAREGIERAFWILAYAMRPSRIIVGGGLMDSYFQALVPRLFLEAPFLATGIPIVPAKAGNQAGVLGAIRFAKMSLGLELY